MLLEYHENAHFVQATDMFIQSFLRWLELEVMTAVCTLPDFSVICFIISFIYQSCQLWGKITFLLLLSLVWPLRLQI